MRERAASTAGLCALGLALLTTRGLESADAALHLDLALAMVERGETTLSIDPGPLWVPSRPTAGGLFYQDEAGDLRSASAPGLALLAVPFVAVGGLFTDAPPPRFDRLFEGGPPRAVLRPLQHDPRVIAFVLIGPLSAALAAFFFVRAGQALALEPRALRLATAALVLGSPLLGYAGTAWTQLPTCAGLAYALHCVCARRVGVSLGIVLALVVAIRPDHLVFVAALAPVLGTQRWRALVKVALPLALSLALLALWPVALGGGGWSLARLPEGAFGLTLSPRTGLILFAPFVLLAPLGLLRAPRPVAALVAVWLASALVLYGGWFDWPASLAYGPRFLVPVLPALALGIAPLTGMRTRPLAWFALVLGLAVNLPGALLVHARIPDEGPLAAWRTLLAGDAVGPLGVDCASTYVLAYPLLALLVAVAGLALMRAEAPRAPSQSSSP